MEFNNYLDELPRELILIIIEYIDISRDKTGSFFIKEIEGIIKLSDRYKRIYEDYMKLIYLSIINHHKMISYNDLKYVS